MAKRIVYSILGLLTVLLIISAGLTAYFWTPDSDPATMKARYTLPQSEFVNPGRYSKDRINLTFHATDRGPADAPVVVMLHGSNASLHTWEPMITHMRGLQNEELVRIISVDLPGHGLTGPMPNRDYSASAQVKALDDFINAKVLNMGRIRMGLDRPNDPARFFLVGNSMGGWLAWHYALAHPEKVAGLILIDAAGAPLPADAPKPELPLGFKLARMPGVNILASHVTPRALVERSLRQSVANPALVTTAMVDRYWELLRYPGNRQATLDRFATPKDEQAANRLGSLTMPTLILWGREDTLIPVAAAEVFKARIPNSTLKIYDNVGHIPQEESPKQVARDVLAWIYDIDMGP